MFKIKLEGFNKAKKLLKDSQKRIDAITESYLGDVAEIARKELQFRAPDIDESPRYRDSFSSGVVAKDLAVVFVDKHVAVPPGVDEAEFMDKLAKKVLGMEFGLATEEAQRGRPHWRPAIENAVRRATTEKKAEYERILTNPDLRPTGWRGKRVSRQISKDVDEFSGRIAEAIPGRVL